MPPDIKNTDRLILASASPRRHRLLKLLGVSFSVDSSQITESYNDNDAPADIVQRLAGEKAIDVAGRHAGAVILGADTLVVHEQKILGKPANKDEAHRMLSQLSDDTHQVMTGVALLKTGPSGEVVQKDHFACTTSVSFGPLERADIDRYVATGQPMDKAGAYGIQDDWAARFVKHIEGEYYTVIGLPVYSLYHHLKTFAPELL